MQGSDSLSPPAWPAAWLELPDGRLFWLKGRCTIGRVDDNDLVLDNAALSRHHALLLAGPAGHTLTDLHSSNGTYLNRELLKRPALLNDGDRIGIGDQVLRYRCTRAPDAPLEPELPSNATVLLHEVRPRLCWLLVTDLVGYSTLTEKVGNETALGHLQTWIGALRPVLEANGGQIQDYIGDAIFAYWPCDLVQPAEVMLAVAKLEAYRARSPLPFRLVLHHGSVLFTKSEQGARLSGQEVNFVFRAEKVAKQFHTLALLSHAAVQTLQLAGRCPALGAAAVEGLSGTFDFYGLPRDLRPPSA